jgi:hypothetical protein
VEEEEEVVRQVGVEVVVGVEEEARGRQSAVVFLVRNTVSIAVSAKSNTATYCASISEL